MGEDSIQNPLGVSGDEVTASPLNVLFSSGHVRPLRFRQDVGSGRSVGFYQNALTW